MPAWLSLVLGGVGGAASGVLGQMFAGKDKPSTDPGSAPAARPVWPWLAGGAGLLVLLIVLVLVLGRKR